MEEEKEQSAPGEEYDSFLANYEEEKEAQLVKEVRRRDCRRRRRGQEKKRSSEKQWLWNAEEATAAVSGS